MHAATFFTALSLAPFYRRAHAEAVALAPPGPGRWLDVGCGPGVVALAAARRGYQVLGVDPAEAMVLAARAQATRAGLAAQFEQRGVDALSPRSAEVVSAASLVWVLSDRAAGLRQLFDAVAPGGVLLVIETTPQMRAGAALAQLTDPRDWGLPLWGAARRGRSAQPLLDAFRPQGLAAHDFHPLLGGLLGVWRFTRS